MREEQEDRERENTRERESMRERATKREQGETYGERGRTANNNEAKQMEREGANEREREI